MSTNIETHNRPTQIGKSIMVSVFRREVATTQAHIPFYRADHDACLSAGESNGRHMPVRRMAKMGFQLNCTVTHVNRTIRGQRYDRGQERITRLRFGDNTRLSPVD